MKKKDLSHISYNNQKGMYIPDQYHMTVIRATRQPIDATKLIENFQDACLGIVQVNEIHIKSRADFEDQDGKRMHRDLFKHIKDAEPTFATESKIMLT